MHDAGGQLIGRCIGRRKAEYVGVANRLGPKAGSQRIANDSAQARVRAAIRFQGRGMIVRLDLEANVKVVVELDDAGIILENGDTPIRCAPLFSERVGGGKRWSL
jgi:hypothetical protein